MNFSSNEKLIGVRNYVSQVFLFFNTTDGQTFYKVALEEWE